MSQVLASKLLTVFFVIVLPGILATVVEFELDNISLTFTKEISDLQVSKFCFKVRPLLSRLCLRKILPVAASRAIDFHVLYSVRHYSNYVMILSNACGIF